MDPSILEHDDVSALQGLGIDVNSRMNILSTNLPILSAAAYYDAYNCLCFLLSNGANIESTDIFGANAAGFAASSGSLRCLSKLKDAGASMKSVVFMGIKHLNVVKYLFEEGSFQRGDCDCRGFSLPFTAIEADAPDVLRCLLETVHCSCLDDELLIFSIEEERHQCAMVLLEHAPLIAREKDKSGNTGLHIAAKSGNADLVRAAVQAWPEGRTVSNKSGVRPVALATTEAARQLLTPPAPPKVEEKESPKKEEEVQTETSRTCYLT